MAMRDRPAKIDPREAPQVRGNTEDRDSATRESDRDETGPRADPLEMTPSERAAVMLDESLANALPNLPTVPGWHFVWASTTNQQNPIQWFYRLGYVPVKADEFPEYDHMKSHSGEFTGMLTCNEMVALKIPEEGYQQIMKEMHHDRPNREADKLLSSVQSIKDATTDRHGKQLVSDVGDGLNSIMKERTAKVKAFE
jgi:hypothetical protein